MMTEMLVSLRVKQLMLGLSLLCTLVLLIHQEMVHNLQMFQGTYKANGTRVVSTFISYKMAVYNRTRQLSSVDLPLQTSVQLRNISMPLRNMSVVLHNMSVPSHAIFNSSDLTAGTFYTGLPSTNEQPFNRVNSNGDVFSVSVVATNLTAINWWDTIVINGWEALKHKRSRFKCCYLWDNGKIIPSRANKTYYKLGTHLSALQYRCPFGGDRGRIRGVALEFFRSRCPGKNRTSYQVPYFSTKQPKNSLALCAKIVYGNVSSRLLIDWLEYYKEMHVSKIVMFTYNVSAVTQKILQYYEETGFVETRPFDFPWKVSGKLRDVGDKNAQAWQDEQVTVFDCQERMRGYSFVSILDLDEFLLPLRDENLQDMTGTLLSRSPTAAGFTFMTHLFIKDWGVVEQNNGSDIVQYFNRTHAVYTRWKNIFMPSRVELGSVSTHEFRPKDGFTRVRVPESLAVINHYRNCYKDYRKVCNRVKRATDYSILRIYNRIKERTSMMKKLFDIT